MCRVKIFSIYFITARVFKNLAKICEIARVVALFFAQCVATKIRLRSTDVDAFLDASFFSKLPGK